MADDIEPEEDEYEIDVQLFTEIEFPVFMEYAAIFAPPERVLEGLYLASEGKRIGGRYRGRTPMEVAHAIYNHWDMETGVQALLGTNLW